MCSLPALELAGTDERLSARPARSCCPANTLQGSQESNAYAWPMFCKPHAQRRDCQPDHSHTLPCRAHRWLMPVFALAGRPSRGGTACRTTATSCPA
jgi:hypothetical protein